jgi:hypothetical protein
MNWLALVTAGLFLLLGLAARNQGRRAVEAGMLDGERDSQVAA